MGKLEDLIGKNLPFGVPEGYFENLPDKVMEGVQFSMPVRDSLSETENIYGAEDADSRDSGGKFSLWNHEGRLHLRRVIRPYLAAAGVVLAVVIFAQIFIPRHREALESAESYVVSGISEFYFDDDFNVPDEDIIDYLSVMVAEVDLFYSGIR